MNRLSYELLSQKAKTLTPYRVHKKFDYMKRWPISDRKHGHKFFAEREENGQIVYDIYYGQWWEHIEATPEEWRAMPEAEQKKYRHYPTNQWNSIEYYAYYQQHLHRIAVSRPDNTIEIVAKHLDQGVRTFMSQMGPGNVSLSSKHDGAIWSFSGGNVIPLFKGIRFTMDGVTPVMHESSKYEVVTRKVNRSAGRELMSRFNSFLTVAGTMFSVMDKDAFVSQLADTAQEVPTGSYWARTDNTNQLIAMAENKLDVDPVGSALAYMLAFNVLWARTLAANPSNAWYGHRRYDDMAVEYFKNMKRKLSVYMYDKHDDVFEKVIHGWEKRYFPSNEWSIDVLVNGVEMARY